MTQSVIFQKLQAWQDENRCSDRDLAEKIGVHATTIWRAKRGLRVLGVPHQLALQKITKIPPSEWAEFAAQTVNLRAPEAGGKPDSRPFGASVAEGVA